MRCLTLLVVAETNLPPIRRTLITNQLGQSIFHLRSTDIIGLCGGGHLKLNLFDLVFSGEVWWRNG